MGDGREHIECIETRGVEAMYYIEVKGRRHYYATLEAAKAVCAEVFEKTRIVLGIYRT